MFALFEHQRFTICNSFANRDYPKDRRSYKVIEGDNREGCTKLSEQKFHLIGFPLILKANHCRRSYRHRYPRNEWMMYVHTYIHTYVCISKDYHQLCMIMPQLWQHNITLHDTRTGRQACSHCKILQISVCVYAVEGWWVRGPANDWAEPSCIYMHLLTTPMAIHFDVYIWPSNKHKQRCLCMCVSDSEYTYVCMYECIYYMRMHVYFISILIIGFLMISLLQLILFHLFALPFLFDCLINIFIRSFILKNCMNPLSHSFQMQMHTNSHTHTHWYVIKNEFLSVWQWIDCLILQYLL